MEEKDKIHVVVKWAQEDVETSNNLLNKNILLFLCMFPSVHSVSFCCSLYCLCVNVYCTTATGWLPNCS